MRSTRAWTIGELDLVFFVYLSANWCYEQLYRPCPLLCLRPSLLLQCVATSINSEVTSGVSNPVKRDTVARGGKVNYAPNTPLKSIAGISVQDLKIDDLRMFCSKNGIKGSRKAKKAPICWAIVRAKEARAAGRPGPYRNLIPEGARTDRT